jgi:cytochrome oxidase assembly protein ShyY1
VVAPVYVELISSDPPVGPDDPLPVSEPELTEANHLSYAFQWFIFAACVVVGWVLAVRRSVRTHRAAVAAGT